MPTHVHLLPFIPWPVTPHDFNSDEDGRTLALHPERMVWFGHGRTMNNQEHMNDREKMMHALGAATLSILPGMGHLYLGVRRGNIYLGCGIILLIIAKFFWPAGWLFYIQLAILAGFDAFAFGMRGRGLF